jgi:hypothetical protein
MCLCSRLSESPSSYDSAFCMSLSLSLTHFAILFLIYKPLHLSSLNPNLHQWVWGNNYFLFSMISLCGSISMLCFCASKTFLFVYRVCLICVGLFWFVYVDFVYNVFDKMPSLWIEFFFFSFFSLKFLTIGYGCWYFGFWWLGMAIFIWIFLSWVLKNLNEIRFTDIKVFLGLFSFLKSLSIYIYELDLSFV